MSSLLSLSLVSRPLPVHSVELKVLPYPPLPLSPSFQMPFLILKSEPQPSSARSLDHSSPLRKEAFLPTDTSRRPGWHPLIRLGCVWLVSRHCRLLPRVPVSPSADQVSRDGFLLSFTPTPGNLASAQTGRGPLPGLTDTPFSLAPRAGLTQRPGT